MLRLVVESGFDVPDRRGREACVWRDDAGGVFARARTDGRSAWIEWRNLGAIRFSFDSPIVHGRPAPGVSGARFHAVFASVLQPIVLQAMGYQTLHASAVLGRGGVMAFCGVSRSGKSTLAYAMNREGYAQIADDATVLEQSGASVLVRLLPFVSDLRRESAAHFDSIAHRDSSCPGALSSGAETAPLRAIFVLRQDDGLHRPAPPRRIPPVQAFAALLTHAHCFDEEDASHRQRLVQDYLRFADTVPLFALSYPPRFAQLHQLTAMLAAAGRDVGVEPMAIPEAAVPL